MAMMAITTRSSINVNAARNLAVSARHRTLAGRPSGSRWLFEAGRNLMARNSLPLPNVITGEPHLHRALDPQIIRHFGGGRWLAKKGENFGYLPAPALDMAVGKRKIGRLVMAVGRHVEPHGGVPLHAGGVAKLCIQHGIRMFIDEHERLGGSGLHNRGKLLPGRNVAYAGLIDDSDEIIGVTVHGLAHVLAAISQLRCRLAVHGDGRSIRRAMIDAHGSVVLKEAARLEIDEVCIHIRMVRAPGNT